MTLCCSVIANAQFPSQRTCGTMDNHNYLLQTRKNYATDLIQYNQMIDQYIQNNQASLNIAAKTTNITIPVVIHVVYNTAVQNISDAQATSQFAVLNNDFQRLNADKINTPSAFASVAGGVGITFCLAQRDPSGNATTGIIHKSTTTTSFTTDNKVKSSASGGDNAWDVTKYVNIWICNMSGGILGYGEFPTGTLSNTYGLVLDYRATGTMGTAAAPFNLGRTGTHEFGHCFNLSHIWGDNGRCGNTDNCYDTPPQKGGTANPAGCNYGTPTFPWQPNTCTRPDGVGGASVTNTNGDMFMNYMDYTDDATMNMFTQQQCVRMLAVVSNPPWNVLASSNGCTPVTSLDASISSVIVPVNGSSTCNNSVTPKITLSNTGSTTITSAKILYKMDALVTQTLNWSGSLASGTSTVLTLNTYSGLTNASHTFSATVTSPNNGTDGNSANNTLISTFTVITAPVGATLPFTERFDAVTFPPTGWLKTSANVASSSATWTRTTNTTGIPVVPTTSACALMDNFFNSVDLTGQLDALRTPALSLVGANSSARVVFDRSHRMYGPSNIDSLNIYISTDCGGTWTRLYTKGGAQLATVAGNFTTAFTPTVNSQWARDSVSLSAYVGQPSVYLKFESRSGWGNNLYLDNINVMYTPSLASPTASFSVAATKCAGSSITMTDASTNSPTSWAWSFPGGTPATSTSQNPSVTYTASGTYTVTLLAANASGTSTPVSQIITVHANPNVAVSNATVCSGVSANLSASGATTYNWNTGATTASISVTPTTTTNYTVTGTNTNGCANTKTVTVTVKMAPTVVASNTAVCSGSPANLIASGATTYSWNTGATTASISVTPTTTTNYTVVGTTSGCSKTKTISVTVNTTPVVAASSATVCRGTAANLLASGATTYTWNTGATTAAISVTPNVTTNYTVTGANGTCSNKKILSVTVKATPTVAATSKTICAGATTTLTASGASTYAWNTGATTASIFVTPSTTTNYTVVGTNTLGCINTKTLSVLVNALPNVVVTSATICAGATATISASGASTYSWNTGSTNANLTVSPSSNSTYTVKGTSTLGCAKTVTTSITVASAPAITVNSSTICAGASVTLSASGVTTYTWNTNSNAASISVSPTSTSVYTVSGNLTGCAVTAIKTATVTVNALPIVSMGSIASPLCVNSSPVTLVGTPTGGNFSGTGVVGSTFAPSVSGAGTFSIMYDYTDGNGCMATNTKTVNVNLCTGISELSNNSISIYPNPAKEVINVMMDASLYNNTSIELYDAIGKLVITEKVVNNNTVISINDLAKGIYTIRIISEGKQLSKRIIKE